MSKQPTFGRILWAIDPFDEDTELQTKIATTLKALTKDSAVPVEPVSIVHWEDRVALKEEASGIQDIEVAARNSANKILKGAQLKNPLPASVLVQTDLSLSNAIKRLVRHAQEAHADLIVVGSQAKKGITRFLLGSFAESLVLQSEIPTLLVSPHINHSSEIKRIIYPSDLTEKSKSVFPLVVGLAREIGASITIFHRIEYLTKGPSSVVPASPAYREAFKVDVSRRAQEAEDLVALARTHGVAVDLNIQSNGDGPVDSIVKLSQAPSTIVAMVSQTKSLESLFLGSVTRQVIRRAECPVWILHPKSKPRL